MWEDKAKNILVVETKEMEEFFKKMDAEIAAAKEKEGE